MKRPLCLLIAVFAALACGLPGRAATPDEQLAAASAQFDAHQYAAAARTLDAFLLAHPTHPKAGAAALALGRCRSELKQWTPAIPAYQKAIASKDPAVTVYAELGLGEAALHVQKWQTAADALNAAVQTPLTPEQGAIAWDWLGQADAQLGRFAPAEQAYQTVLTRYPQSDYAADALFGAGLAEMRLGKTDAARDSLKTLTQKFPANADVPEARAQLGQIALGAKHFHEARAQFQAALAAQPPLDPDSQRAAQEGEINAELALRDDAGAAAQMQSLLAAMPPNAPGRAGVELALGNALYRQKQYGAALPAYEEAGKATDPAVAAQGLYWAAHAQLALGHPADAARLFTEVAARYPQSPDARLARAALGQAAAAQTDDALLRAQQLLTAGNNAAAVAALDKILASIPTPTVAAQARYLRGTAENGENKPAPAVADLTKAVAAQPNAPWVPDAQTQLAWLYLGLKSPARAEAAAESALTAAGKPTLPPATETQARLALAQADIHQQKWDAAGGQCQKILTENPTPPITQDVLYMQASIAEKQNRNADALPLWQKLATDYPSGPDAAEALLHVADSQFAAKQYQSAADQYTALLTRFPHDPAAPQARFQRASCLYDLGQYPAAAAEFDQLASDTAAGAYQPEGLYWAGASYEKANDSAQAIARLTHLISAFPENKHVANAKIRLAALQAVAKH